jgi:hemerythrin-like domain-containing protein|tara:strand:- start:6725 stop:7288 length:564 start_codon:yes stop_codon:yes gene_type:complete
MGKDRERHLSAVGLENGGITVVENPLDFIVEDHSREREVCALIDRLVSAASLKDAEIHQILAFLEDQLPQHLADEEIDLFPMMLERCDPEDEIEKVIAKLHADHGHALADTPAIIAIIQALDAPDPKLSAVESQQMAEFAYHARRHLTLENAVILPIARARLTDEDLRTMKIHMLERRGVKPTSENK